MQPEVRSLVRTYVEYSRDGALTVELDGDAPERDELHAAVGDAEERVVAAHGRVGDHDVAVGGSADEEAAAVQAAAAQQAAYGEESQRIGRNDPCPCGSGKKYKHCHGQLA